LSDFTFAGMWTIMSGFLKSMTNISADLCTSVLPVVVGAFIIQLVWQGFNIMRGQGGSNHVLDVFAKSLRVMIICTVALQSGIYNDYITGMISGPGSLTDGILLAIDPGASGTPFDALDSAFKQGMSSYADAESWALGHLIVPHLYWIGFDLEFPGPTVLIANGIFLILFIILLVLAFADLVVNSLALAIIFAVGPVFIACYAYEPTAQFAQTWLSGALKWSFTNVVIVVVINMFVFIVNTFVGTVTSSGDGGTIIAAIFGEIMAVVALIILCGKAHQIAADFVGGVAGTGFTQRIGQVATGAIKGAKNGLMTGGPMGALRGAASGAARGALSEGGGGGAAGGKGLGANFLGNMGGK
jgi:type IV secretion system protein VirB6